jgi:VWFA-related protein
MKVSEETMRLTLFRALILAVLMVTLMLPAGDLQALAQAQQPPAPQQPDKQQQKKPEQTGDFAISVEVPLVTVDVVATDNSGNFISGLRKDNFRILEDGVPQAVTNFAPTDAPITMVLLIEFSKLGYEFYAYKTREGAYDFLNQLNKDDWVALETFDLRPRIEVDFTRDKMEVKQALSRLVFPGFTEANLFDALMDTVDRLQDVKGKKSIFILASGYDTFSKHTLDQALKRLQQSDVTIFALGVGRTLFEYYDNRGLASGINRLGYYQAENQLSEFCRKTGGRAWFPRFEGELPSIFRDVAASLRNQYSLGYIPTNKARDGKFRKIKVQLVGPDGSPLVVHDQKGKNVKYVVYAREGYTPPKGGIGD